MRGAGLAVLWVAGRAWLVWLLAGPQEWVAGDVSYYASSLGLLDRNGLATTLVEYPVPAVGVLAIPWSLTSWLGEDVYLLLFVAFALVTDLVFTVMLGVRTRGRPLLPVLAWVLAVPLLGSTTLVRFDLLPGILCGWAVLLLARRPATAGVLAAVATGVKLWPALLLPALLGVARDRRRVTGGMLGTGLVLAVGSLLLAGWARLFSPLLYQSDRGLQVESVAATPVMVAKALAPDTWTVGYAPSRSFEVDGPAVPALLAVSTLATVLYVVAVAVSWWQLARLGRRGADLDAACTVWLALAAVTGFVVVGKVFSPQYLLWVVPVAVAGLAVADTAALRTWTVLALVACGLTHVVFPLHYDVVTVGTGPALPVLLTLAARNVLVAWLFGVAAVQAWKGLARAQRGIELERQPPGLDPEPERTPR